MQSSELQLPSHHNFRYLKTRTAACLHIACHYSFQQQLLCMCKRSALVKYLALQQHDLEAGCQFVRAHPEAVGS